MFKWKPKPMITLSSARSAKRDRENIQMKFNIYNLKRNITTITLLEKKNTPRRILGSMKEIVKERIQTIRSSTEVEIQQQMNERMIMIEHIKVIEIIEKRETIETT